MIRKGLYILLVLAWCVPLHVQAARKITIYFDNNISTNVYTLSLASADNTPLFTFPAAPIQAVPSIPVIPRMSIGSQIDNLPSGHAIIAQTTREAAPAPRISFIDRFFDKDKTHFIFNSTYMVASEGREGHAVPIERQSYWTAIDTMTKEECEVILKQQSYAAQATNYVRDTLLFKTDPKTRAQLTVRAALTKLDAVLKETIRASGVTFVRYSDRDTAKLEPHLFKIYEAIREFVQIIGVNMPDIRAWYVRHKGKIALTAGALAVLTYAYYNNAFGGGVSAKPASVPTTTQPVAAPANSSWFKANISTPIERWTNRVAGEVGKKLVEKLAGSHNVESTASSTVSGKIYGALGYETTKQLAISQGLIPKPENPSWADWIAAHLTKLYLEKGGAEAWHNWKP